MCGTTAGGFVIGFGTVSDLFQNQATRGLLLLVQLWACGQRASVVQAKRQVHSLSAEGAARAGAPHRQGRLSTQRLMRPARIVERDPGRNPAPRLAALRIALQIHVLVLERTPQPLDEHVRACKLRTLV